MFRPIYSYHQDGYKNTEGHLQLREGSCPHAAVNVPFLKARSQNCEKRLLASSCLFAWKNSVPSRRIFMKFDIWVFLEKKKLSRKFKFCYNLTRITGTLHEDQYTFLISRSVLLEWEVFQTKVVDKIKTHVLWSINVSPKSCRLWDNVEKVS